MDFWRQEHSVGNTDHSVTSSLYLAGNSLKIEGSGLLLEQTDAFQSKEKCIVTSVIRRPILKVRVSFR